MTVECAINLDIQQDNDRLLCWLLSETLVIYLQTLDLRMMVVYYNNYS